MSFLETTPIRITIYGIRHGAVKANEDLAPLTPVGISQMEYTAEELVEDQSQYSHPRRLVFLASAYSRTHLGSIIIYDRFSSAINSGEITGAELVFDSLQKEGSVSKTVSYLDHRYSLEPYNSKNLKRGEANARWLAYYGYQGVNTSFAPPVLTSEKFQKTELVNAKGGDITPLVVATEIKMHLNLAARQAMSHPNQPEQVIFCNTHETVIGGAMWGVDPQKYLGYDVEKYTEDDIPVENGEYAKITIGGPEGLITYRFRNTEYITNRLGWVLSKREFEVPDEENILEANLSYK